MATSTVTASDPYNVALAIYRNREWVQQFTVSKNGSPIDISQDELVLVLLYEGEVVLSNHMPVTGSGVGSATFVFADGETETLTANERYEWQFLRRPNGAVNSDLLAAGPLNVSESPAFTAALTP